MVFLFIVGSCFLFVCVFWLLRGVLVARLCLRPRLSRTFRTRLVSVSLRCCTVSLTPSAVPALLLLYSMQVFEPLQPGVTRVILATNIAESSVTIPDVRYVVDLGSHKV